MEIKQVFEIAGAIIASVGGAAGIIVALSTWLGKVWANRILEKDKLKYNSELEKLKNKIQSESQKQHLMFSLYFEGQFKLYNNLWISLSELKNSVDELWAEANIKNLNSLVTSLKKAKKQIQNSALLIEPQHYYEIMNIIADLERYRYGKEQLIFVRKSIPPYNNQQVREIIEDNRHLRNRITEFVTMMLEEMRTQIGGASGNQLTNRST